MTRKLLSLIFVVLLVSAMTLVGCKRSATPPMEELPPEEGAAMIEEAAQNTDALEATPTIVGGGDEPEATEPEPEGTEDGGEAAADPTATMEPTPVPTLELATPVPTDVPMESAPGEPSVTTTPGKHIVQPGENLFRIALRYGLTVEAIAQANGITNASLVYVGQELAVPSGTGTPYTPPPSPPSSDGVVKHVVQPGDNLFRIALRYNYNQYYIARYNGISNPSLIYVGQVIQIPAN